MATLINILSGNIQDVPNKNNKENFKNNQISTSLTHGQRFVKYQKKITKKSNKKEGFTSLLQQTRNILNETKPLTSTNAESSMNNYSDQYNSTISQYEYAETGGTNAINDYYARINPNNPYLNTNIRFRSGEICYVTNQGVVKLYGNPEILKATAGLNGCPSSSNMTQLNIPWNPSYNNPGTTIPTKPPLITGTPMSQAQSCGYEGTNVYVNEMVGGNVTSSYKGCFADNSSSPAMTFIGGSPPEQPPSSGQIQNPDFDYPQIAGDSYQYINSNNTTDTGTTVPGWNFYNACLINNSTAWGYPIPYPNGNQAACIQGPTGINQFIYLSSGSYYISFYAVGRPAPYSSNQLTVAISDSSENNWSTISTLTPGQSEWQLYTYPFNISQSAMWVIAFQGFEGQERANYSTAIQHVIITQSSPASTVSGSSGSSGSSGTYTEETCKQQAIYEGYKYYALQNANSSGYGYCAVSNDYISSTQYGPSTTTSNVIILWQSNTSGQTGNSVTLNNSGSLVVTNTSDTTVFTTPNPNNLSPSYLGCYGDGPNPRAFSNTVYNGSVISADGPWSWNSSVQSCQQAAAANDMAYFGLQASNIEGQSVCFIGNSLSQSNTYGPANNCTTFPDGTVSGGSYSNAIYQSGFGNINYFLSVTDTGLLAIYLGQNPDDQQALIWSYQGTPRQASQIYSAANTVTGTNWISSGTTLQPGEFVGSPNGYCALIMQPTGNLEFVTFTAEPNCATVNGSQVGGIGANAIYELSEAGNIENMGQVAYIDQNSTLYPYQSNNVAQSNTYSEIKYFDSPGNILSNAPTTPLTAEQCQEFCDSNDECYGFTVANGMCYPKNNNMYPVGQLAPNFEATLYVRNQVPVVPPFGIAPNVTNINSSQFSNYVTNGETVSNDGSSINGSGGQFSLINPSTNPQLMELNNKLNTQGNVINNALNTYNNSDVMVKNQSTANIAGLHNYEKDLENLQKKIKNFDLSTENILDNSDIAVLQQNYNYMFWTILAIGTVAITMNVSKF